MERSSGQVAATKLVRSCALGRLLPDTGSISLVRSLVVRSLLTGGVENAAYNSYTRT